MSVIGVVLKVLVIPECDHFYDGFPLVKQTCALFNNSINQTWSFSVTLKLMQLSL